MSELYAFFMRSIAEEFDDCGALRTSTRGVIRRVRHRASRKLYIYRTFSGNASACRRLIGVHCDHLPQIYEAAEQDGQTAVLEEYISGDTLAELLRGGTMSEWEVRRIALEICEALYVLHSLGIVHRDVKPENVMMDGGRAVLIDFDAARERDPEKHQDTQVLGTQGFAPPEQYGISQTDATADIYALGVLINVLLTGEHPSVTLAPGRWGRIVQRCTMVSPKKRYRTVRALMEAL